jgi:riboflavin kinase/FMN adenylyltransferase
LRTVRGEAAARELPRGGVTTIGNYDGIHRGQQVVIDGVVRRARELAAPAVVVTFDPHPLAVLDPPRAPSRITSDAQRDRLLGGLGVDAVWVLPFTDRFASRTAESFVRELLGDALGAREIHVGSRFGFGRGREGDVALLERLGAELGFAVRGVPELAFEGGLISSTRIRAAILEGDVELAAELLGRPFARGGRVVAGDRLGRRIGWPTANLEPDARLLPAHGVYAARLRLLGPGELHEGVANVGVRPTRGGDAAERVEIHLFDFDREIYGEAVEVEFHRRLRGERRFPDLEALAGQIGADAAAAREYFSAARRSGGSGPPGPEPREAAPGGARERNS